MKYKEELSLLKNSVKAIFELSRKEVISSKLKGEQDIVTSTDLFIEKELLKVIKSKFKNDSFLTEEFYSLTELNNRTWIIDPIDGTSNYASGLSEYVVQIALYDEGDIQLSYIYYPGQNDEYYAVNGSGAYLNDERYQVDNRLETTFMISMVGITHKTKDKYYYKKILDVAIANKYKMRMLGSIGLELALMSNGVFDLFYSNVTNIWDLYPGILLLREAGAILLNETGNEYSLGDLNLFVCKNEEVLDKLKDLVLNI
jgi:myo-inositol-1(or 4)-monophosphatase